MLGHTEHLYEKARKKLTIAVASREDNQRLGVGWEGSRHFFFFYKAFGCFEFLFKSCARGFCVYVCACFLRKKAKEELAGGTSYVAHFLRDLG